jgi:hypothetical protein
MHGLRLAPVLLILPLLSACESGEARAPKGDDGPVSDGGEDTHVDLPDDTSADDGGDDTEAPLSTAASLVCMASSPTIHSMWDDPSSVVFTATGTWTDEHEEDVTEFGTWTIGEGPGGTIEADGVYTASPWGAGVQTVRFSWEGLTAECSVETYLEAVVNLTGDAAMAAAVDATGAITSASCAPYVLYPLDGSRIPADFFSPEIQWVPATGQDTFVITFATTFITLTAITQDASWTPEGQEWWAVTDPDSGTAIDMSLAGGRWDASAGGFRDGLCQGVWPTALSSAWWGARGSVIYWTPATSGLWEVDVSASAATPFLDQSVAGGCVGCHSVNLANPSLLTVTQGAGGYGAASVSLVSDPAESIGGGSRPASFSSLDPTGTRLIRNYYGVMYLDDLTTETELGVVPTRGWASHPNWSPDGSHVVYSSCGGALGRRDWTVYDCDLHMIEVLPGDTWGPDMVLATAPPGLSYHYPTFSPDSMWIAFNRTSAGEDVYDEPTAELMMMSVTGTVPIVLANANGLPNATNSWPRWGPIVGDQGWLSFASRRAYALQTSGAAQVWVAGVDLAEAAAGGDGSFAPVWLSGQSTTTSNHTPVFIERQGE